MSSVEHKPKSETAVEEAGKLIEETEKSNLESLKQQRDVLGRKREELSAQIRALNETISSEEEALGAKEIDSRLKEIKEKFESEITEIVGDVGDFAKKREGQQLFVFQADAEKFAESLREKIAKILKQQAEGQDDWTFEESEIVIENAGIEKDQHENAPQRFHVEMKNIITETKHDMTLGIDPKFDSEPSATGTDNYYWVKKISFDAEKCAKEIEQMIKDEK